MTSFEAVSLNTHGNLKWSRTDNFRFTSGDSFCPVFLSELPSVLLSQSIAFVQQGGRYIPVAIQSLKSGENYLVSDEGDWLTRYIPALYRAHPFLLANDEKGEKILCIQNDATTGQELESGESFFDSEGNLSPAITDVMRYLSSLEKNKEHTFTICSQLQKMELLKPWKIQFDLNEKLHEVNGLFQVDEEKFLDLSADQIFELKNSRGLMLIYSQLFSMQNISRLITLTQQKERNSEKAPTEVSFFDDSGSLNFDSI
ncbi:MAG: SapC family protein [Pseudomonadales bacterium]|nr:SapC family protein [Pseudomonadales bacterium]MCP5344140.1 SapC family protein [Pseudomonadales bacterium]